MTLDKIRTFVKLVELGSYTKTSESLHISQPTVTSHIKSLEKALNRQLIVKKWKRYEPTDIGRIIYSYCIQILKLEEKIYDLARKDEEKSIQTLKIASTDKGSYIIPEISLNFEEVNPDVQLFFSISNTSTALSNFLNNKVDCLITPYLKEMEAIESNNIIELGYDKLALAVSRESDLLKLKEITKSDLEKQTFILRESGSNTRDLSLLWMVDNEINFTNSYEMNYSETIIKAVEKNTGISLLPKMISSFMDRQIVFLDNIPGLPIIRKYVLVVRNPAEKLYSDFSSICKNTFSSLFSKGK